MTVLSHQEYQSKKKSSKEERRCCEEEGVVLVRHFPIVTTLTIISLLVSCVYINVFPLLTRKPLTTVTTLGRDLLYQTPSMASNLKAKLLVLLCSLSLLLTSALGN